jgi:hypothetical protein
MVEPGTPPAVVAHIALKERIDSLVALTVRSPDAAADARHDVAEARVPLLDTELVEIFGTAADAPREELDVRRTRSAPVFDDMADYVITVGNFMSKLCALMSSVGVVLNCVRWRACSAAHVRKRARVAPQRLCVYERVCVCVLVCAFYRTK